METNTKKKIAVYTAIFGNFDNLKHPKHPDLISKEADFYCFTDNQNVKSTLYKVLLSTPFGKNFRRNARYFKINGSSILDNYDYVIWCDGSIKIVADSLSSIIKDVLKDNDIAVFKHRHRKCIYDEGLLCAESRRDSSRKIFYQIRRYKRQGFPKNFGLLESGVLVKRNNSKVRKFMSLWWKEIQKGSIRDQLSFDFIRWKYDMNISYFDGTIDNNTYFELDVHNVIKNTETQSNNIFKRVYNAIYRRYKMYSTEYFISKIKKLK